MPTTRPRPALNLCQILHLKHRRFAVVAVAAAAVALAAFALMEAGAWLVLEDPLQPADAIVVLGGGAPFRAMEAAKLYNQGWAHQVWLTQGSRLSDLGPARLRIDPRSTSIAEWSLNTSEYRERRFECFPAATTILRMK